MRRSLLCVALLGSLVGCAAEGIPADATSSGSGTPGLGAAFATSEVEASSSPLLVTPTASNAPAVAPDADVAAAATRPSGRLLVYTATLRVVVRSTADAMASVQKLATSVGGYLQESDASSITIRVPAAKFEPSVAAIEKLGEVVDRAVKAADVSEQMLDLDVRLDNARRTRDRLVEHLAKSEKMEDTIKLEAELGRVTATIEELEGKKRLLASQVAMSTIRVELNAARPQTAAGVARLTPFAWVEQLGAGLVAGPAESMPRQPRFLERGPSFDPPRDFVRYFSSRDLVEAMNADGVRLRLSREANFDRGPLDFWQSVARKSVVETRGVAVAESGPLAEDASWSRLVGTRDVGGETFGYLLMLTRTNDNVFAFEAWAPKKQFDALLPALTASARSLRK